MNPGEEAALRRTGLEPMPPAPMRLPRLVDEGGDQLWLRCQVDGVERECDLTIGQAWGFVFALLAWIAKASRR